MSLFMAAVTPTFLVCACDGLQLEYEDGPIDRLDTKKFVAVRSDIVLGTTGEAFPGDAVTDIVVRTVRLFHMEGGLTAMRLSDDKVLWQILEGIIVACARALAPKNSFVLAGRCGSTMRCIVFDNSADFTPRETRVPSFITLGAAEDSEQFRQSADRIADRMVPALRIDEVRHLMERAMTVAYRDLPCYIAGQQTWYVIGDDSRQKPQRAARGVNS